MSLSPELRAELVALHPACFGWAMSCCARDRAEAEDVVSEAYARVLVGGARWQERAALRTFLFGVVRMVALERRRAVARLVRFLHAPREPVEPVPSAEQLGAEREEVRALIEALAKLPDRQREVLHLVFYEELTVREAAEVMGVSIGTAAQHYERGKQRLAALIGERGAER